MRGRHYLFKHGGVTTGNGIVAIGTMWRRRMCGVCRPAAGVSAAGVSWLCDNDVLGVASGHSYSDVVAGIRRCVIVKDADDRHGDDGNAVGVFNFSLF